VARRLTRKQIKQDEFVSLIDTGLHWMGQNWRRAAIGFAGALGVALLYWAVTALFASRGSAAARALDEAVKVLGSPVGATAGTVAQPTFASNGERLDAAEKAFSRITTRYWLTPQAHLAKLYLARIAADRGDLDGAVRKLADLAGSKSDEAVVRMAMLDLVNLRLARNEGYLLAGDLEAMASGRDPRLPRDTAMFKLAEVRAQEGKAREAAELYRKLAQDFPQSGYRYEAQQRSGGTS